MYLKAMAGLPIAFMAILVSPAFAVNNTASIHASIADVQQDAALRGAQFGRGVPGAAGPHGGSQPAAADHVPNFDVRPGCQATDIENMSQQSCLEDERAARDDLMKQWGRFSAQDKAICTLTRP